MGSVKPLLATLASLCILLAAPAAAPAVTTCASGNGLLEVQLPASNDRAILIASLTGQIEVSDGDTPIVCGGVPPNVSNTNVISVFNGPFARGTSVAIDSPARFAPGASTENGGTPEIEISVNLNDQQDSELAIYGGAGVPIRLGASGINPNASPGEAVPDADIFPAGVEELFVVAGTVIPNTLSAQGGAGTGSALTDPITFYGSEQADVLIGGEGADVIDGYAGSDTVLGMGGDDEVEVYAPAGDNESVDGGTGVDDVHVDDLAGVTVDLAIAGPQSPGSGGTVSLAGIENVFGTEFNDVLRGDAEPNVLVGGLGDDELEGRGAVDTITGGAGADSLFVRDGGADGADCGPEVDTVTADPVGIDTLTDCENQLFPAPPGGGPGGGGGGGGPDVPGGTAGRCGGKRVTITGTNAGETISGTRSRDVIDAGGGNDRVKALGGNDVVCGASGRDRLDGGRGADTVSGGAGNDKLSGGAGNDKLLGGTGRDRLSGGDGNDRLLGGAGRDALLGGPGKDSRS